MLFRCLRCNIDASCHTLHHCLPPSTNSAAYQRPVSSTRHCPSRAAECIALAAPSIHNMRENHEFCLLHLQTLLKGSPSEYCYKVWCAKTRMVWLPDGEKSPRIRLLTLIEFVNTTNGRTDRHTDRQTDRQTHRQTHRQTDTQTDRHTDRQTHRRRMMASRPHLHSIMRQKWSVFSAWLTMTQHKW